MPTRLLRARHLLSIALQKAAMREASFVLRKAARASVDPAPALSRLLELIEAAATGPCVISGYAPIRTEIDPTPALHALHEAGHRICLPVVVASGQPLVFRAWQPGTVLSPGVFGARVPPEDAEILTPDILIVPLLAFDAGCRRLGYGGGFYDRTLAELRAAGGRMPAYGLAYGAQQVPLVPTEPTDIALNAVATETAVFRA